MFHAEFWGLLLLKGFASGPVQVGQSCVPAAPTRATVRSRSCRAGALVCSEAEAKRRLAAGVSIADRRHPEVVAPGLAHRGVDRVTGPGERFALRRPKPPGAPVMRDRKSTRLNSSN